MGYFHSSFFTNDVLKPSYCTTSRNAQNIIDQVWKQTMFIHK